MLRPEVKRVLEHLFSEGETPDDRIPEWMHRQVLAYLFSEKLVDVCTLLMPGKEDAYPHGLISYTISEKGKDALFTEGKKREQDAKQEAQKLADDANAIVKDRKKKRHDYLVAALNQFLSFIFGVLATLLFQYRGKVAEFILKFFGK